MASKKPEPSYQLIGLATASIFLMLFAFTMYKLERSGATPYKTQLKNGYATMDDSYLDPPEQTNPIDALLAKRAAPDPNSAANKPDSTRERFEFYSVLPDFQVDVPADGDRLRRSAAQAARDALDKATDGAKTQIEQLAGQVIQVPANARPSTQPARTASRGNFLQAGSFADMSDASRRRAEVTMLGLKAKVESAEVQNQLYHRVKLGPFTDATSRSEALQRLHTAGIDAIIKSQ